MEVDIRTGKPLSMLTESHRDKQEEKDRKAIYDGVDMAETARSEAGQKLTALIQARLSERLNALMRDDPECQAYMKILSTMGSVIDHGVEAAKRVLKETVKA